MKKQNYQIIDNNIKEDFLKYKGKNAELLQKNIRFSWSNWGFGVESLETSIKRLARFGIEYIELHGNRYGENLGYNPIEVKKILDNYGVKVSGICGMYSKYNDLSSNIEIYRQNAIGYIKRNLELAAELEANYFLIVPGAVGRNTPYDDMEFHRSVETLKIAAESFKGIDIRGAVEPIREADVSFCHSFKSVKQYIEKVDKEPIKFINGDVYHMLTAEDHIGKTLIEAKGMITNLHMADTNRKALGLGFLDLDTIIMALYLIGYNNDDKCFVSMEPLGSISNPYKAMYGYPDQSDLDKLVKQSIDYFRERESILINSE